MRQHGNQTLIFKHCGPAVRGLPVSLKFKKKEKILHSHFIFIWRVTLLLATPLLCLNVKPNFCHHDRLRQNLIQHRFFFFCFKPMISFRLCLKCTLIHGCEYIHRPVRGSVSVLAVSPGSLTCASHHRGPRRALCPWG